MTCEVCGDKEDGRVVSMALVFASAVNEQRDREVLGFDMGHGEDRAFWLAFLRQLVIRGLKGEPDAEEQAFPKSCPGGR